MHIAFAKTDAADMPFGFAGVEESTLIWTGPPGDEGGPPEFGERGLRACALAVTEETLVRIVKTTVNVRLKWKSVLLENSQNWASSRITTTRNRWRGD